MRGGDCLKHLFNSPVDKTRRSVAAETQSTWPRGPMDKASAYGAGDCRFESCRGHMSFVAALVHDTSTGFISRQSEKDTGPRNRRLQLRIPPGASCPLAAAVCLPKRWIGITQSSASTSSGQAATNPKLQITCVSYSSHSYTRFMQKFYQLQIWPRGPMDKASAYGAGDCRFESCRGHCSNILCVVVHACLRPQAHGAVLNIQKC